jgi:hypothetical protein
LASETVTQRLALHVGHRVVEEPVGLARVEDREDVGVGKPGCDLDLAQKALGAQGGGKLGTEHLEGHRAAELAVVRKIHRGHPAATELVLDRVPVGEGRLQAFQQVRHRHSLGVPNLLPMDDTGRDRKRPLEGHFPTERMTHSAGRTARRLALQVALLMPLQLLSGGVGAWLRPGLHLEGTAT